MLVFTPKQLKDDYHVSPKVSPQPLMREADKGVCASLSPRGLPHLVLLFRPSHIRKGSIHARRTVLSLNTHAHTFFSFCKIVSVLWARECVNIHADEGKQKEINVIQSWGSTCSYPLHFAFLLSFTGHIIQALLFVCRNSRVRYESPR